MALDFFNFCFAGVDDEVCNQPAVVALLVHERFHGCGFAIGFVFFALDGLHVFGCEFVGAFLHSGYLW